MPETLLTNIRLPLKLRSDGHPPITDPQDPATNNQQSHIMMKKISDEDIVSAYNSLCESRNHLNSVAHNLVTGIQDFGIALRELDQRVALFHDWMQRVDPVTDDGSKPQSKAKPSDHQAPNLLPEDMKAQLAEAWKRAEESERWLSHYNGLLVKAKSLGYLPDSFKF